MKKFKFMIVTCIFGIILGAISPQFHVEAEANKDELTEEFVDEEGTKYISREDAITGESETDVYKNDEYMFTFETRENGDVYLVNKVTGEESLAIHTISTEEITISEKYDKTRAGSEWVLNSSGYMKKYVISWSIIEMGKAAIKGAIWEWCKSGFSLKAALIGGLEGTAQYILEKAVTGKSYETDVMIKKYNYSGCLWLLATEFVYPGNNIVFMYGWQDNPQLGVAPYACKVAATKYPY